MDDSIAAAITAYAAVLPHAALAAAPSLRVAADRQRPLDTSSDFPLTVHRVDMASASEKGLCLYMPAEAEEVLVVTLHGVVRRGTAQAAAEAGMWWVERCTQHPSVRAGRLLCCLR